MAQDYTITTNYRNKTSDDLILGDEFAKEFENIQNAVNSKLDEGDNLSDLNNAATARSNLGVLSKDTSNPIGMIVMWSGGTGSIPSGWELCDGASTTDREGNTLNKPDLRDRFIVGEGNSYTNGDTGGEDQHTLTISEMPSHDHGGGSHSHSVSYFSGDPDLTVGAPAGSRNSTDSSQGTSSSGTIVSSEGGGNAHENRPPYYALAFIIKL